MLLTLSVVLILAVAGLAYIRLAPSNPARWHVPVRGAQDADGGKYALRVLSVEDNMLSRIHAAMLEIPGTTVLAGDPTKGSVTYVTRSKWMGFPDYTTVEQTGHMLKLYARSRFAGRSDFGVNRRRLERVIAVAQGG